MCFNHETVKFLFMQLSQLMGEQKERLCSLDAEIGDGDLGLTMSLGFQKAYEGIKDDENTDVGTLFIKAGMQFAQHVPSTMGTLMASGFMGGGKVLKDKDEVNGADFKSFITAFKEALMVRGKAKPGDKTILDVFDYAEKATAAKADDLLICAEAAEQGAAAGLAATKDMMAVHGKAAVFREKTLGKEDPGAIVGYMVFKTLRAVILIES